MTNIGNITCTSLLIGSAIVVGCFLFAPAQVHGQGSGSLGNNAVYNPSGSCCIGSSAFIDAYEIFTIKGYADICDTVYKVLQPSGYSAAVIDARGLSGSALKCTKGSPWNESGNYLNKPSTILLPAGTIQISTSWVLPNGTKLIGEGTTGAEDISGIVLPTTIQDSGSLTSGAMIQFGDSTNCPSSVCTGISVDHLVLDGDNQTVTGILNENAQDSSYVNHVTLYRILGTGLSIGANPFGGSAQNSGPYENINYDTGPSGVSTSTCASINGLGSTHGIHGLSCVSPPDSQTAILLDSSNNTLRDVRIVGFFDGILVGSKAAAHSNVLLNIFGDTTTGGSRPPVRVVHISNNGNPVTDLSIMGVNNPLGGPNGEYSIYDDLTSAYLIDSYVAMYVIGQSKYQGFSRYTTSPNAATWVFGNGKPLGGCPTGSLYSCIGGAGACPNGSGSAALWGCVSQVWQPIK